MKIKLILFIAISCFVLQACSDSSDAPDIYTDDGTPVNDASDTYTDPATSVRVIFLLDQSSSMTDDLPWNIGNTHWDEVSNEFEYFFNNLEDGNLYFGLDAFPDGTLEYFENCYDPDCFTTIPPTLKCMALASICNRGCSVDLPPIISLSDKSISGPEILLYMSLDYLPGQYTNTPLVEQMRYYNQDLSADMPYFYSGDGNSYLVIISDGEDTCEDTSETPDYPAIIDELASVTSSIYTNYGIKSIAIGFSDTSSNLASELNAIAANGGTGHTTFFPITESGGLRSALDTALGDIAP